MKQLSLLTALLFAPPTAIDADAAPVGARAMKAADKNKDGKLSLTEYLPLDVQAKHHGNDHFTAGDTDQDGFLDTAELAITLRKQTWFAILSEGAEACFTRLDANNDGKLDAAEYRQISRMGAHAEQHFKGADSDKDSFLNKSEFTDHAEAKLKSLVGGAMCG